MTPLLQRAIELARTGQFTNQTEVARALKREGFRGVEDALFDPLIRKDLNALCRTAQGRVDTRGGPRRGPKWDAIRDQR